MNSRFWTDYEVLLIGVCTMRNKDYETNAVI